MVKSSIIFNKKYNTRFLSVRSYDICLKFKIEIYRTVEFPYLFLKFYRDTDKFGKVFCF